MGLHRIDFEELRSLAFGSISTSLAAVGAALSHPAYKLEISNATDDAVIVSFDGTTDHKYLPTSTSVIYDFTMDSTDGDYLGTGKTVYVRHILGAAPTSGSVYVSVTYRENRD